MGSNRWVAIDGEQLMGSNCPQIVVAFYKITLLFLIIPRVHLISSDQFHARKDSSYTLEANERLNEIMTNSTHLLFTCNYAFDGKAREMK